jgi:serine/threonine protein kinase
MHEAGVCHRDIKPDNIMMSSVTGAIKIIDFNVAKYVESKEFKMHSKVGLDQWNAPEVLQGNTYDEKIDLWGVGCILYFALTGDFPFLS